MKIKNIAQVIKQNKKFLITVHDNPDGDSLGSGLALGLALKKMGKETKFLLKTPIPKRYGFLPGIDNLVIKKTSLNKYNILFVLDTAGWDQMEGLSPDLFSQYIVINIDHHIDNTRFGSIDWVDTKASAVGELVYYLLKRLMAPITPDIAACLYTAILTDTGCFQFTNTTTNTHRITAELIQRGVSPSIISEHVYERMPFSRLKLLQYALSSVKLEYQGQIIWMWITQDMLRKSGANRDDIEGFIDYLKSIAGVKVAIVFKETPIKNEIRVTFRSKAPNIHVNRIAHKFSGGGHPAAAGCTIFGSHKEVKKKVLVAVINELKMSKDEQGRSLLMSRNRMAEAGPRPS